MNFLNDKTVILASNSPRRRELLAGLDIDFTIDTATNFKEAVDESVPPEEIPAHMSEGKSLGFHRKLVEGEVLITADTIVILDGRAIGKPHSREEAVRMLHELSGRTHTVVSAVTIRDIDGYETFNNVSTVEFRVFEDWEIDYYIDTYYPFDKAGAYGIQEWIGYSGIVRIEGSPYNVMGLPVHLLYKKLVERYGLQSPSENGSGQ